MALMSLSPTSCSLGCVDPLNQQHELDHFHQQTPERKDAENNLIVFVTINLSLFVYFSPGLDTFWDSGYPGRDRWLCPFLALSTHQLLCCSHTPEPPCFIHGSSTSLMLPTSLMLTSWVTFHGT